ncbi:hypothetical protein D9M68_707310 [compost metagenome]
MLHTATGAHHLDVSVADGRYRTHTVFMFQVALQRYRDDLHIVVRVRTEATAATDGIII